jgi:CRISPR/Cas system endoribonuclease Cas6 (RAMP superfamily)
MMGRRGIGAGSSRMAFRTVHHLDLDGQIADAEPLVLSLAPCPVAVETVSVDFLTPTELKSREQVVSEPLFPILFARVRDRIATLRTLYGGGPMDVDFRALGERASAVRITASSVRLVEVTRHSSRTGQRHPIGGFAGWASYAGPLAEFLPWLEAAAFTGVGRQTTWGKGEIRVRAG